MSAKTFDIKKLTIKEALQIKALFGLTDAEAIAIFFGGNKHGNI